MSLIESLIGSAVTRPDNKRILPTKRPLPIRPRDFFELFAAMGTEATVKGLFLTTDLRQAEPRTLTYVTLGRWVTADELAAVPQPYKVTDHLHAILSGQEFRASIVRRIVDAYPERPRLCFVRIPRCAGQHFLTLAEAMHPIVPDSLGVWRPRDENRFIPALGRLLGRFTLTRTLMVVQSTLAPFVQSNVAASPDPAYAAAGLQWTLNAPPRRAGDRLFTILRDPRAILVSEVNAIMDALLLPPEGDTRPVARWRARLPANPATADEAGRKHVARHVLRTLRTRNPICHALADGTTAGALHAARLQDVEMATLDRYEDWIKYTWDVEPGEPANTSTPHLTVSDLAAEDRAHLESLVAEDLAFYDLVVKAYEKIGDLRYSVRGREL